MPTPANRRFRRALAALDGVVDRLISERLRGIQDSDDLLGLLLTAQQGADRNNARQLRDEVMTVLLAGHETSATVLTWAWHLLGENPSVAEGICGEVESIVGSRGLEADDLALLELTRAVIQESMRLYPPAAWFARLAAQPDRIGGFAIPSGAILLLSPWLIQRDSRFWPEPEHFNPDRFISGTRPAANTFFPFGGGPRTCLGNHFALTEMVVALATLVPRFQLVHSPSAAPAQPELLLTLRPAGGLAMRPARRKQSGSIAAVAG